MNLSEEQVLALAPDESSRKSGKDLATLSKWVTRSFDHLALWGECQGSGSKPYQAQVDLTNIAFQCSCPSRKFPCKHGLGLLLLYTRQPGSFTRADQPAWVTDWLGKRTEKAEVKVAKEAKPVDEAAQAKRQQARLDKVNDGLEELSLWIKDIIRSGILQVQNREHSWFENMARRMVDAQAPGLAQMIRELGNLNRSNETWHSDFLEQLTRIYLISAGFKHRESVNPALLDDLRTAIGFTQSQEELKKQPGIRDTWLVIGKQVTEEDAIVTERFWLYGTSTGKYALVLQFIVRGQGMEIVLSPGAAFEGSIVYFPSSAPLRAIITEQKSLQPASNLNLLNGWTEVAQQETLVNAALPFSYERPYLVRGLTPVKQQERWWLKDAQGNIRRLRKAEAGIWKILSLSGGQPLDMAVVGKDDQFEPVGLWSDGNYKIT